MIISEQVLKSLIDLREKLNIPLGHLEDYERRAKPFVIYKASESGTVFHLTKCTAVGKANMKKDFRRTSDTSGVFKMLDGSSRELSVCTYCLKELNWQDFKNVDNAKQTLIKNNFSIEVFFRQFGRKHDLWQELDFIPPEMPSSPDKPASQAPSVPKPPSKIIVPGCYVIYSPNVTSSVFHITDCSVLKADCDHQWTGRGSYRKTCELSGKFHMFGGKRKQSLRVCPVYLTEFNNNQGWKGFSLNDDQKNLVKAFTLEGRSRILEELGKTLDKSQKAAIRKFNIQEFFKACNYKSQIPDETLSRIWACRVDPENPYPSNWTEISRLYRIEAHYRCDECGADLSKHKRLLVLHHIDGLHSNVKGDNFRVLCTMCHSKQWRHDRQ